MSKNHLNDVEDEEVSENDGRGWRVLQTAVILLILFSFVGVILITFYNQFTGRQTLPAALPDVAYLAEDEDGVYQIFRQPAFEPEKRTQLTFEAHDVYEFAVSPDGTAVAYVTELATNGLEIKLFKWDGRQASGHRTVFECPNESCNRLVWHPDGRRLVIERRTGTDTKLYWLDSVTGEVATVLADNRASSRSAAFSADGSWLSFADPSAQEMELYELGQGSQIRLTNFLGNTAVWHPQTEEFLFSDLDLITYHGDGNETNHQEHSHDFAESNHLFWGDTTGDTNTLMAEVGNVDDGYPAWSPDGQLIAFGRQPFGTNAGRQLWLSKPDGTDARPLTDAIDVHHGPPIWSPDGRFLLFQHVNLEDTGTQPGIYLLEIGNEKLTAVAETGILPAWLP